jgi:hypothetical protein
MFFHRLLALATVYFPGASSAEGVFSAFPVACTSHSAKTAIITFLLIYISNIFVERQ